MERSPDLEAFVGAMGDAMAASDMAALEQMLSRADGSVMIGSDAAEYFRDIDGMLRLTAEALPAQSQITFRMDDVRGYVEGDVGWFDGTGTFERGTDSVAIRMTGVAHKEDGQWRFVQAHASIGVPNEQMFDSMFQRETVAT
jgi:hypothetical protein